MIAAQRYLALGFSIIPLRGKIPTVEWGDYQRRRPTQGELQRWHQCNLLHNIGIVCGEVSHNLVVLDFDDLALYDAFSTHFSELSQTYTVASGAGGRHVYLQTDRLPLSQHRHGVELRANGHQVVAPPSTHPLTRRHYRICRCLPIAHFPHLDEITAWLKTLQSAPATSSRTVKADNSGDPLNQRLVSAITQHFELRGYRQKGDWLNGQCIYPERHAHHDRRSSFGFNTRTGYGYCWVCGSMLAKDIALRLGIDPSKCGGVITHNRRIINDPQLVYIPYA